MMGTVSGRRSFSRAVRCAAAGAATPNRSSSGPNAPSTPTAAWRFGLRTLRRSLRDRRPDPDGRRLIRYDRAKCTDCGGCVRRCPTGAQSYYGEERSVADIMKRWKRMTCSIPDPAAAHQQQVISDRAERHDQTCRRIVVSQKRSEHRPYDDDRNGRFSWNGEYFHRTQRYDKII